MSASDTGSVAEVAIATSSSRAEQLSDLPAGSGVIDVFVAHRSRLLAEGVAAILGQSPEFRLLGAASDDATIDETLPRLGECVVLLDCMLLGENPGLLRTATADSRRRVVLITSRPDDRRILEAVRAGVRGVLLESMGARLLTACIRKVAAGEEWVEQGSAGRLLRQYAQHATSPDASSLSRREVEIVRRFVRDLSSREIAGELCISTATVKSHVHSIFRKLGVATRAEAVARARTLGLV